MTSRKTAAKPCDSGYGSDAVQSVPIEILEGLKPGDQVVLSDMSAYDGRDRVRLN